MSEKFNNFIRCKNIKIYVLLMDKTLNIMYLDMVELSIEMKSGKRIFRTVTSRKKNLFFSLAELSAVR